ncbi:immunity 22 family protein [Ralstonia solanacearum]|uniref:Immunity 22 family protein n=1 Tax=Ralstonia solanacearum TaxID=305 RepID=A0AAE3T360_RALSL|nr:immunity 22 family protein [Ralstonia solanacearum]MBB6583784.1 immunity 22 family protein [Ralstonia solanacearum]MDB0521786.1 immunity 22 family protein [Ralstonia solanacearum]
MHKTESSHFYLGRISDTSRFSSFLAEHYGEDENQPISEFYGSQGEFFCDHDFMETGQREPGASLAEFFAPHSYSEEWSQALCEAARAANLEDANALIFINCEQIKSPRSVRGEGFELVYIGKFEYPI